MDEMRIGVKRAGLAGRNSLRMLIGSDQWDAPNPALKVRPHLMAICFREGKIGPASDHYRASPHAPERLCNPLVSGDISP